MGAEAVAAGVPERVWYRNAIEGLFISGLGALSTPAFRERLRLEAGIDLRKLAPSYPLAAFVRAIELAGDVLAPELSRDEQQRLLGQRFIRGYFSTPLGHALSLAQRLAGPEFGLARLPQTCCTVTNYVDARATKIERGRATITWAPVAGLSGLLVGIGEETFAVLHRPLRSTELSLRDDRLQAIVEWD